MYERFFGLQQRPFDLAPNPHFLFLSGAQREVLSTLRYALTAARGLALLTGEAGTGKTTLIQTAIGEIGASDVQCVLMSNPTLNRGEFYEFLASGFELGPEVADSKTRFLFALRRHVEQRHAAGHHTAVVIDEAQSLPYELLEEVRLLSNIETTTTKLLTVVLAGQPELATRLNEVRLRQLKQRIALRCDLTPFNLSETAAYIAGRLRLAGGSPASVFTRNAVDAIYTASHGVARVVNVICENALISGFAAQIKPVPRTIIDDVIRDFDISSSGPPVVTLGPVLEMRGADSRAALSQVGTNPSSTLAEASVDADRPSVASEAAGRKRRFSFF
jgi:general secretion pathway protein A